MELVEDLIRREYVDNEKSLREVGKMINVSPTYVKSYLIKMGLSVRTSSHSIEHFLNRSIIVHGDKYSYEKFIYLGDSVKGIIICPKHGEFNQRPNNHYKGQGCPKCNSSHGEDIIRNFLVNNNIEFAEQYRIPDCRYKNPLPFDFAYWIEKKLHLIEYNGKQHYEPIKRFGGQSRLNESIERDKIKLDYCVKHNIPLLVISYKDDVLAKLGSSLILCQSQ